MSNYLKSIFHCKIFPSVKSSENDTTIIVHYVTKELSKKLPAVVIVTYYQPKSLKVENLDLGRLSHNFLLQQYENMTTKCPDRIK